LQQLGGETPLHYRDYLGPQLPQKTRIRHRRVQNRNAKNIDENFPRPPKTTSKKPLCPKIKPQPEKNLLRISLLGLPINLGSKDAYHNTNTL
jgi:hypothetical protein